MQLIPIDVFGHISFFLTAVSFYVRDIFFLRVVAIISRMVGVIYNYFIPESPLWLVIYWLIVFVVLNVVRIANLLLERRSVNLSDRDRELYDTNFRNFTPVEFMKLMRLTDWHSAEAGDRLAVQGEKLTDLKLVYNGEVEIVRDGARIAVARDGTLVGEMSFIQGGPATATVSVSRPTRYLSWERKALRNMLLRNPTIDMAMRTVFSADLARKLGVSADSLETSKT